MNDSSRPPLPQSPGMYLWHILDMSYLEVGLVVVRAVDEAERDRLAGIPRREDGKGQNFHVYRNDAGEWLSMHHQAAPNHVPGCDRAGRPWVDGYRPTDIDYVTGSQPKSGGVRTWPTTP